METRINKTALVRDYLARHPTAGPTEIASALSAHGISAQYVANIKQKLKLKNGVGPSPSARTVNGMPDRNVIAATEFIKQCGGLDEALEAFEIAQRVVRELS